MLINTGVISRDMIIKWCGDRARIILQYITAEAFVTLGLYFNRWQLIVSVTMGLTKQHPHMHLTQIQYHQETMTMNMKFIYVLGCFTPAASLLAALCHRSAAPEPWPAITNHHPASLNTLWAIEKYSDKLCHCFYKHTTSNISAAMQVFCRND